MSYESVILDEQNYGGLPFCYYPLDEANGTVANDLMDRAKGTNNSGAYVGTPALDVQPSPISREANGWTTFNGSSQYVNVGTLGTLGANLANGLTVEMWLKSSVTNALQCVFGIIGASLKPAILVTLNSNINGNALAGYIRTVLYDTNGLRLESHLGYNTGITDGNVHHLAVTFLPGSNAITVAVDGAAASVAYAYRQTPAAWGNLPVAACIGCRNNSGTFQQFFNGSLGRAAIYNYVLAASRVTAHYLAGLNGTTNKRLLMG